MSHETAPPRVRSPRRSTADRLRDALMQLADYHGQVLTHSERPWASITFAGSRHSLSILFAGEEAVAAGENFIASLPDHEFTLPRQLVADAAVTGADHRMLPTLRLVVECELLLLDDA